MRTVRIKVYKFDELSEKSKQAAIENLSDINVDHDWWEFLYEDSARVGLKITSFDLDRNRHAKGGFIHDALFCATAITVEHGEGCETYNTAQEFLKDWAELVAKHSDGVKLDAVAQENESEFDIEADQLEQDFLQSILEDYSILLQQTSDHLQSDEAIIETIKANDYEFTQDGQLTTL